MDALRCLNRHLVRRIYELLNQTPTPTSTLTAALALT